MRTSIAALWRQYGQDTMLAVVVTFLMVAVPTLAVDASAFWLIIALLWAPIVLLGLPIMWFGTYRNWGPRQYAAASAYVGAAASVLVGVLVFRASLLLILPLVALTFAAWSAYARAAAEVGETLRQRRSGTSGKP